MPDADELEGDRRLALGAFAKLSRYGPTTSSPPPSAPAADLPPLLSCCFQLLRRLDHADPELAARCAILLRDFIHSILSRDPDASFAPALEVCLENFVDISQLRRSCTYLDDADDAIWGGPRDSTMAKSCQHELPVMLQLMSHCFVSSVQDDAKFEKFFSALSWSEKAAQRAPELGLAGAISLVRRSYWFSMPVIAQAHFVLLASRCVGNGDLDRHLQVFENAVSAYLMYLPALGVFDGTNATKNPFSRFANMRLHHSCIPDATNQKLNFQINRLLSFCKTHCDDALHAKESNAFDICVSFIEENQHIFPEQSRQEAVIFVKKIVSNILGCAKQKETHESGAKVSEEIIFLAAVLRLMSSSFLEVLLYIRKMRVAGDRHLEKHILLCISETIRLLAQYEANVLNIHDLFGMTEKSVDRERASVLMLFHFASLLVLCLRMRFGFVWKACIVMIMMAMNLMIDEDGSLSAFQFCIASEKSAISSIDQEDNFKGSAWRKSTTSIALQFSNLRKRRIQDEAGHDCVESSSLGSPPRCKSADGRAFFESIPGYKKNSSEWDDLVDFIECEDGVDYSRLMAQRKRFKEFKDAKWMSSRQPIADMSEIRREHGVRRSKRLKASR